VKGIADNIAQARVSNAGVKQINGSHDAAGFTFGIVVSRFNEALTVRLADTVVECLKEHGARERDITVVWVPGAFEIPLALQRLAGHHNFAALVALGAVIQGETPHATLITAEVTRGIAEISRKYDVPVVDGVLAALNWAQAETRTGTREKSRGWHAALAAIEMANLMKKI
jgi:6,7-dimethyl-8-ribityllumazine synthase